MLFDYEHKDPPKHTKLKVGWGMVVIAAVITALVTIVVLCFTGHDGVATGIVERLPQVNILQSKR